MKKHIQLISTKEMDYDAWLAYRVGGIGASEIGTVMGLNPYKSSIALFYEKLGETMATEENMAMFMGKEMEPMLAKLWQYWDGDTESMIKNYRANQVVRRCRRVNAYVRNPAYPSLFVSLDRLIMRTGDTDEGVLELKTIEGWESDKWEGGIPPGQVVQVQCQLLVTELLYGELATMKNGRHFSVLPFEKHEGLQESIAIAAESFWAKVVRGRQLMTGIFEAKRGFNQRLAEELEGELQKLEPEPDGSEAYSAFLKEKYQIAIPGEITGGVEQYNWAREHVESKEKIKVIEAKMRMCEQQLKSYMGENDCLDFGSDGKVTWKADANGVRRFLNKSK